MKGFRLNTRVCRCRYKAVCVPGYTPSGSVSGHTQKPDTEGPNALCSIVPQMMFLVLGAASKTKQRRKATEHIYSSTVHKYNLRYHLHSIHLRHYISDENELFTPPHLPNTNSYSFIFRLRSYLKRHMMIL